MRPFLGSYDECVGTNLFFEEIENPPMRTNIFEKDTPIRLKPYLNQTKIIKLKQVKLPRKASTSKQYKESVVLNLNQEYNTILEKLEQGVLNIEDLAYREPEPHLDEHFNDLIYEPHEDTSTEPEKEIETLLDILEDRSRTTLLEAKYERLKRLVRRPVKRMKAPDLVEDPAPEYRSSFEYHNLERQVCQSSDAFRTVSGPIVEKSFVGGVYIDRCVLQGLIPASNDLNRVLSKEEQRKVFTIDNFENLSLPARYLVLKRCVSQIEELIEGSSADELKETDENGRTIGDICDIFRKLIRALEHTMARSETVEVKGTHLVDRDEEEYVKYKYEPGNELLGEQKDVFNYDEWTTEGKVVEEPEVEEEPDGEESDESMEEDSDQN